MDFLYCNRVRDIRKHTEQNGLLIIQNIYITCMINLIVIYMITSGECISVQIDNSYLGENRAMAISYINLWTTFCLLWNSITDVARASLWGRGSVHDKWQSIYLIKVTCFSKYILFCFWYKVLFWQVPWETYRNSFLSEFSTQKYG